MTAREIPVILSMRPEPDRDRWGRYVLSDGQGGKRILTRQTTLAHTIDDTFGLTEWKRRMVLQGAAIDPMLLKDVSALARRVEDAIDWRDAKEAKQELGRLCDEAARAAGAEQGSKLGTLLHTITEYADAGRFDEIAHLVPEELLDDLAAYLTTMRDAGLECPPEYIERILVNDKIETAGTTDRIVRLPEPCSACNAPWRIADLKTQKTVDYGWLSIAIQLAGYAYADAMVDAETGEPQPMLPVCACRGIVMHLPVGSGTCTLYEIDLQTGWTYATLAHAVRMARSNAKAIGWKYDYVKRTGANVRAATETVKRSGLNEIVTPADSARNVARYLITSANHPEALRALWTDLSGQGLWTDELTQLAKLRKAELAAEGVAA